MLAWMGLHAELFFTPQMIASHLEGYTDSEIGLIKKDLDVVRSICLAGTRNVDTRFYLATAGGPGARKTTILEKFVSTHPEYQEGVYLDPDPRTLKYMVHTYYARSLNPLVISTAENYDQVIRNAYDKWRAGSNTSFFLSLKKLSCGAQHRLWHYIDRKSYSEVFCKLRKTATKSSFFSLHALTMSARRR